MCIAKILLAKVVFFSFFLVKTVFLGSRLHLHTQQLLLIVSEFTTS